MPKLGLAAFALLATALLAPGSFQRRAKPKVAKSFKTEWAAAMEQYDKKAYGKCLGHIESARNLVQEMWTKLVRASFPDAPEGWRVKDHDSSKDTAVARTIGLGGMVGKNLKRTYFGPDGKQFVIELQLDSPAGQMMAMMFTNPLMRQGHELIEYDGYQGLLKADKSRQTLKLLLLGKHYLEGTGRKMSGDEVLEFLSQKNVDKMLAAIKS